MDWEQFGAARRSQSISLWLWHFCFSAVLGKGWFRKVFLVEYRPLRKMVTLKTMEKSELRDGDLTESLMSQKWVLEAVSQEKMPIFDPAFQALVSGHYKQHL
ncbi:serine/threonine-protein kinase N1-like isoform X2 [Mauremys reevesii]|uniref:serine/threonine-protein kinase N1-like isoform X2 n=1 Tax=Mauremys reevesii TaxID=260615 RepID=UPI00193EF6FF|nr:serine/threonine-protein kinase N1-like isoform X2 [Mauremys reevesii]